MNILQILLVAVFAMISFIIWIILHYKSGYSKEVSVLATALIFVSLILFMSITTSIFYPCVINEIKFTEIKPGDRIRIRGNIKSPPVLPRNIVEELISPPPEYAYDDIFRPGDMPYDSLSLTDQELQKFD